MKVTKSLDSTIRSFLRVEKKARANESLFEQQLQTILQNDYIAQNSTSDYSTFDYFYSNARLRNTLMVRRGKELSVTLN